MKLKGNSLFSTQKLTNQRSKSLKFVRRSCHNRSAEISVEPRNEMKLWMFIYFFLFNCKLPDLILQVKEIKVALFKKYTLW